MARLLRRFAETRPDELALADDEGITTWRELNERVDRLSGALLGSGLAAGDVIAVHAANRREYFEVMAAASHIGLRYVLVNWHWTAQELHYVLRDAGVRALFSEPAFAAQASEALVGLDLPTRVAFGTGIPGFVPYAEFVAAAAPDEPAVQVMGTPMFYTSGTTGRPKGVNRKLFTVGVPIDHLAPLAEGFAATFAIPDHGRTLLVGPVYHSAQWAFSLPAAGRAAGPSSCGTRSTPPRCCDLIDRTAITNVHLVPDPVRAPARPARPRPGEPSTGLSLAAVWHGAAPCSPPVKRAMIDWWGPMVPSTTARPRASVDHDDHREEWLAKAGSVGRPLATVEVHRASTTTATRSPSRARTGEIYFRNTAGDDVRVPQRPGQDGRRPPCAPGVFTTGDVGYLDDDGYLFLSRPRAST